MNNQQANAGRKSRRKNHATSQPAGLLSRKFAVEVWRNLGQAEGSISDKFDAFASKHQKLEPSDRALAFSVVRTCVQRQGQIKDVIARVADKGLPKNAGAFKAIIYCAVAQIMFLDVANHAVVDISVRLAKSDHKAKHYAKLLNAVLRRITREKNEILDEQDEAKLNTPDWLWNALVRSYGSAVTQKIAQSNLKPANIDVSVASNPKYWAEELHGTLLPNGSIRLTDQGAISSVPGFEDGQWWVQDMAASLPVGALGEIRDCKVIDLCAAPGGKTAQLISAGAEVTAIDRSENRLNRMRENLNRLQMNCEIVVGDATSWQPEEKADIVLVDAPCTATGILRRHPDSAWQKSEQDLVKLAELQSQILGNAASMVKTGGLLIYCTCSLLKEECEQIVDRFLNKDTDFARKPIKADDLFGLQHLITDNGDLRCFPFSNTGIDDLVGMDGFYAARLQKT